MRAFWFIGLSIILTLSGPSYSAPSEKRIVIRAHPKAIAVAATSLLKLSKEGDKNRYHSNCKRLIGALATRQNPEFALPLSRTLMERALRDSNPEIEGFAEALYKVAGRTGVEALQSNLLPSERNSLVLSLMETFSDFGDQQKILDLYRRIPPDEFFVNDSERFSTYVTYVVSALRLSKNPEAADELVARILKQKEVAAADRAKVLISNGLSLLADDRMELAFGAFEQALKLAPDIKENAISHYWLAFAAHASDEKTSGENFVKKGLSGIPPEMTGWQLDLFVEFAALRARLGMPKLASEQALDNQILSEATRRLENRLEIYKRVSQP